MKYEVDFLLPWKLQKICYYGVMLENTLGHSVCRIFYFWLVSIVNLNTRGPLLHCTCFGFKIVDFIINGWNFVFPFTKLQMPMPLLEESSPVYLFRSITICVLASYLDIFTRSLYIWPLETSFFKFSIGYYSQITS